MREVYGKITENVHSPFFLSKLFLIDKQQQQKKSLVFLIKLSTSSHFMHLPSKMTSEISPILPKFNLRIWLLPEVEIRSGQLVANGT